MRKAAKFSAVLVAISLIFGSLTSAEPALAVDGLHQVLPSSPCTDVFVLGARGSGQDFSDSFGLGPEVYSGVKTYAAQMPGYDIGFDYLAYPAQDVSTLTFPNTRKMFYDGLDIGVTATLSELGTRAQRCASEHWVLAGYSQGAMVMRRTVVALVSRANANDAQAKTILSRLDGILAIADGDRHPGQGGVAYDNADPASSGVWWTANNIKKIQVSNPSSQTIPESAFWSASRYHSVCHSGDLVCDNTSLYTGIIGALAAGIIHGTIYKPGAGASHSVLAAAQDIATLSRTLNPKLPSCSASSTCTPFWVGSTWTQILSASTDNVTSATWISTPLPGAMLHFNPGSSFLSFTPTSQGAYPWALRLTLADGTTKDVSGTLLAYDFPPAVFKPEVTLSYVPTFDGTTPYSTVEVLLSKTSPSDRQITQLSIGGGFYNDPFVLIGGDANGNGKLDFGETWVFRVNIPWTTAEPGNTRTRTILINALDPLVPNYQFPDSIVPITLYRT